jgi:succinyl-diaminopimelate desuccinylase
VVDLLARTAELIDIPSPSFDERAIADHVEAALRAVPGLEVTRIGDNVIGRTELGRSARLVLAGHTDTVPANGNEQPRVDGDTLWGLGASDMKSGLAVMLELARAVPEPAVDVTYVFYVAEEVAAEHNGLRALFASHPDLLTGDVALLGEPTAAAIEAGCQGTMRMEVRLRGARAHTARPWMGRNAIHRLGGLLEALDAYEGRRPVLAGCEYREAVQAVRVEGGVAGNVVPDLATVTINHRFAPDRSPEEAEAHLRDLVCPFLDAGDDAVVVDVANGSPPAVDHPLLRSLVERSGLPVAAKLGWTDVARFAAHGIPAANFGPGDATLAHAADERVERDRIDRCFAALADLLRGGADGWTSTAAP